ncbi:ABC transporter ATP-binding protein [Domibacillus sp. DTU_2020_1001157_1_SI_ALB_TIR_016]|uniref:ABC transporter ATP-binding protein n=1 Tax=Domibacillus sp. DTU_2020_1001157_1_SI_ALB_TIR_016 TaxID=3077789 RepID=UPI0028E74010|nr:ABC transporter ATP-binding protein [Domibacillus sp. DTU_2020_1001157_1_SI_ALB_TIR_016]WNS80519.1 ABC transporter ATP-binding protein [Domibacillus sp. DTU_2020_1001157_1_SI_ALB_TIR_016]
MSKLRAEQVNIGYGAATIVEDLTVDIPAGKVTTIIGPNGCGKSTLLKTMARLLNQNSGSVYLNGADIHRLSTKEIAKQMAILPQTPEAPAGLTVYELISYGRFPHQKGFGALNAHDKEVIQWAMDVTGTADFRDREIDALSGGQRQRVWIAMALAQETDLILLDEPTTYLDLAHQLEVLELLQELNEREGRTIVMVLHDLNHAARFADYLVAMRKGSIICEGTPETVMTKENLRSVFQIDAEIVRDPRSGKPVCLTYDLAKAPELALAGSR